MGINVNISGNIDWKQLLFVVCIVTNLPDIDQVCCSPAIAGNGEVAGLGVQGEQLQVHRAAKG